MEVIISVVENQPGETIPRHIHHGEEAFYVLQGATVETSDGKQINLPTGAAAINKRDVPHAGLKVLATRLSNISPSTLWTRELRSTTPLRESDATFCAALEYGDVRFWHVAGIWKPPTNVGFLGVKRTCRFALHMSASDPKRTSPCHSRTNI